MQKQVIEVIPLIEKRDHQGIPWQSNEARKQRRTERQKEFALQQIFMSGNQLMPAQKLEGKFQDFYSFRKFHKVQKTKLTHFQLSKCFLYHNYSNNLVFTYYDELNFYNPASYEQVNLALKPNFNIVGLSQNQEHLLLAGLHSEIGFLSLITGLTDYVKVVQQDSCIINQADFIEDGKILLSDNNQQIRICHKESLFNPIFYKKTDHYVNYCTVKNNMIVACLDNKDIPIYDRNSGDTITLLQGHSGYNFCAKFSPIDENQLATSSEDGYCLIWDMRKLEKPVSSIKAFGKPCYDIQYTKTGLLVCIESNDTIQIIDTGRPQKQQCIEFFGECTGCAVHDNFLHFGVYIRDHQGIFEFQYNLFNNKF